MDSTQYVATESAIASALPLPAMRSAPRGFPPERLDRVVTFVTACLGQPLGVREMAEVACMSPFHFSRVFKRATGHSPHHFLMWLRVERARGLLADTDMPLSEIAKSVGYRTQTHFTSVFRRMAGVSPGRYRKERRPRAD
jgi:AraC family transcriptional regulator